MFFDFAITRKKTIIFNYDEEEYLADRGFYFPLSDMPFPKVQTVNNLIKEMNSPKDYDDADYIDKFCQYERLNAVRYICDCIFNGNDSCKSETIENDKPNILLYAGDFSNIESKSNLIKFSEGIDPDKYNIFVSFCPWMRNVKENPQDVFDDIPKDIGFLPFSYNLMPTVKEKLDYNQLVKKCDEKHYTGLLRKFFKRTFRQQYGSLEFEYIFDFEADDFNQALIFMNACENSYIITAKNPKVKNIIPEEKIIADIDSLYDIFD